MRICFVSRRYWPAVSGMSVYAEQLLRQLVQRGHDVTLVSQYRGDPVGRGVYGGGEPPPQRIPAGVRAVPVEATGEQRATQSGGMAGFETDIARLRDLVVSMHAEQSFDVLHAQYGWPTGMAVLQASARIDVPNVVSIQGGDGHWVGTCCSTHRVGIRTVLGSADRLLIGSSSFAEEVRRNHEVPVSRFDIVGGATDTEAFSPADRRALGAVSTPPVLLFHGRVDRRKGVLDAVEAVSQLRSCGTAVRLIISGIGPDTDDVASMVSSLALDDVVDLRGYVSHEDAPRIYREADIFLSPTESEGFSNTILEAMASGLPVVSTDAVGVVDCIRDGENGVLVPVHDVPALVSVLQKLLADEELRHRLAAQALEDVRTYWSWPALSTRIERVYEEVAGTTPDKSWCDAYGSGRPLDLSCRFLRSPHLL